ncbi:MAG TPA: hypothetical protein VN956_27265 [Pyrinomonadaceae bacterium]|nr:hypothetical protein [Pyrinomonadaceae bacterium]
MYERIDKNLSEEAGKFVLPNMDVNQALALLQSWDVEESSKREEQRETWEYLKRALDEDRLSDRKLFP